MKKPKDEDCNLGIRFEAQQALEAVYILEGFIHNRQSDDRIDEIGINLQVCQHAE